jgi:hypothetical protein
MGGPPPRNSSSSSSSSSSDGSGFSSASSFSSGQGFEFTDAQNAVIAALARDMVWVATPLVIVALLYGLGLLVSAVRSFRDPHVLAQAALVGLAMLFYLALGIWTNRSARAFNLIVRTRGRDIDHLMNALDNLRKMYGLLSLVVKLYVVLVAVAVAISLIAALVAAFKT